MSQSQVTFLHDSKMTSIENGKKVIHEEYVIHGTKGLLIKFFHKDEKSSIKIIVSKKEGSEKYMMKMQEGDKKEEKELTKEEVMKEISKNKNLKFAVDYLKTQKGGNPMEVQDLLGMQGGAKKKSTKKSSKKASKKTTKKGTKKSSKKLLEGGAKKKSTKKSSKKASKKSSKKAKKSSK